MSNNILNITSKVAIYHMNRIANQIRLVYKNDNKNITIKFYKGVSILDSFATTSLNKKPEIYIGVHDIFKPTLLNNPSNKILVDDMCFINAVVAIFHEYRHMNSRMYGCEYFRDNLEDNYYLAINYMALEDNEQYYENNYLNMACEIDAEQYAINAAYGYLQELFPKIDCEKLIVEYVNERAKSSKYKIPACHYTNKYESLKEINAAFDEQFEISKHLPREVNLYSVNEAISILNNSEWQPIKNQITTLMGKENDKNLGYKMDEKFASITLYKYPEYNKLLNSKWKERLTPESVFGLRDFPLEDWQLEMYQNNERE